MTCPCGNLFTMNSNSYIGREIERLRDKYIFGISLGL